MPPHPVHMWKGTSYWAHVARPIGRTVARPIGRTWHVLLGARIPAYQCWFNGLRTP